MNKSTKNEVVELSMRGDKKVVDVISLGNDEFFNDLDDNLLDELFEMDNNFVFDDEIDDYLSGKDLEYYKIEGVGENKSVK